MVKKPDRERTRSVLSTAGPHICPSLLACDFSCLGAEACEAARCGAVSIHWDVMDASFVPNLTYGPPVIRSVRPKTDLVFDAHLMMSHPEKYLDDFLAAGCDTITVHLEAAPAPGELLAEIRRKGALAGLAINPKTPVEPLTEFLDLVDIILIMSVMPGFGGQPFDRQALEKLVWAKANARPGTLVQVDGGVNRSTIAEAARAGADLLVVGSAFYGAANRREAFDDLVRAMRAN